MKLSDAIETLERIYEHAGSRRDDMELVVVVHQPGTVGGIPCVGVDSIHAGFDWNAGRVLLVVDTPLTKLSADDIVAINKSMQTAQSWHAVQANKKLVAHIAELEHQLASLLDPQG